MSGKEKITLAIIGLGLAVSTVLVCDIISYWIN